MTYAEAELTFYGDAAPMTEIASEHRGLLSDLPTQIAELCKVVQGVVIHPHLTALYEFDAPALRREREPELRSMKQMLAEIAALDPRPLVIERTPDKRLLGTCRSFSVLLCGLLRWQRVPARARCGFGRYGLAEQSGATVDFDAVRIAYQTDDRLRVGRHIISGGTGVERSVDLDAVLGGAGRHGP